jgi:hypothetical protein
MTGGHTSKEGWADSHAVCYDTTKSCQTTRRDSRLRGATSPAEHVPPTLSRAVHMTQLLHKLCQPDRCDSKVLDLEKSFWPNSFLNSLCGLFANSELMPKHPTSRVFYWTRWFKFENFRKWEFCN